MPKYNVAFERSAVEIRTVTVEAPDASEAWAIAEDMAASAKLPASESESEFVEQPYSTWSIGDVYWTED